MARPPRGRLPGTGRTFEETDADELPLELPRVDPIRPRSTRIPRTEPMLEPKFDEADADTGPRRFMPPLRAAIPDPPASPRRMTPEQVDNPFDYYAMPKGESDPHSRPIVKPSAPVAERTEFLTSKYYTPRSDLTAKREFDENDDQTANWARSVRPGRPILEPTMPQEDDETPVHLRHLPSRVRDHLRAEPKMPQASETLGSFAHSAPATTQVRTRSGVPLPLAPELRAPVPQDVRVTRQIPDLPMPSFVDQPARNVQYEEEVQPLSALDVQQVDAFHENARDDFAHEPEFDSASDEAVTEFEYDVPPLVVDEQMQAALRQDEERDGDTRDDFAQSFPDSENAEPPSWMRHSDQAEPPPPVVVSDWDQDEALHALTSRIRNRAVEKMDRYNKPRAGFLKSKLIGAVGQFGATIRDKARDVQNARAQVKARLQSQVKLDFRDAPELRDDTNIELRAMRDVEPVPSFDPLPIAPPDFSRADDDHVKAPRRSWFFFSRTPRVPVVRVSVEANRSVRRKRQSRLYEDIVAWIVVPPFIIGLIYGGLELAKFLSNSPLGKLLSGD